MEYTVPNFFYLKRDKACVKKIIRSISIDDNISEVTLAKTITSVITHILIEMEGSKSLEEQKAKAKGYKLFVWLDLQNQLIGGDINSKKSLEIIKEMIQE